MELTRRQAISGFAGIILPLQGCAAQAIGPRVTPEAFGARGDGVSDDYDAFQRMIAAVSGSEGSAVVFGSGRRYFLGRHISGKASAEDLIFRECKGLTLEGNGATVAVKGDFTRNDPGTRGLSGLRLHDCQQVVVRDLTLNGNVIETRRSGKIGEPPSHGLYFQSCSDVLVQNVTARHFAGDGLYIRESRRTGPDGLRRASRRFVVRDSRFLFNGRQGLSVIQLRGGLFENCDFSYTGYIDSAGIRGGYGAHSPAAGVDVEPNSTPTHGDRVDLLTGDILFRDCRMKGNYGAAFLASKYARGQHFQERVRVIACQLECNSGLTGGRDGFIFDVPEGEATGCVLQMVDKTAYVGWYPQSSASPRFVGNTVSGRAREPGHPLLEVRRTRGAPVIEGNRLIAQEGQAGLAIVDRRSVLVVRNPNAIVRNNELLVS